MKYYQAHTELTFGMHKGNTLEEVCSKGNVGYINWCIINLDHFYVEEDVIDDIATSLDNDDIKLTEKAKEILANKLNDWENEQDEYEQEHDEPYYERDDRDHARDTFDALTDGQYGDYEDFKENGGDMDRLMDGLGF